MLPSDIIQHLSQDPVLARIIPGIQLSPIHPHADVFNALVRSVVSQQLSTKAAATIYQRFLDLFEQGQATPQRLLAMDTDTLRHAGLSRQKVAYTKAIADFFSEGATQYDWESLPDEEIVRELTQIKGVGVWTVEMILMFHLGRPDVFPLNDLGIQQSMIRLYGCSTEVPLLKKQMQDTAASWRPWRSFASRYHWQWRDNHNLQ